MTPATESRAKSYKLPLTREEQLDARLAANVKKNFKWHENKIRKMTHHYSSSYNNTEEAAMLSAKEKMYEKPASGLMLKHERRDKLLKSTRP